MPNSDWSANDVLRYAAAIVSLGAAGLHFTLTTQHFQESFALGIAFAALAWFQVTWAVVMGVKPTSRAALAGAMVNFAGLAVYFVASTRSGAVRNSLVGTVSVVFGVALVLGGLALARLTFLSRPVPSRVVMASSLATAVAVIFSTTAVLVTDGTAASAASAGSSHKTQAASSMSSMNMANPYMSANVDPTWRYTGPPIAASEVETLTKYAGTTDSGHVMETPTCNTPPTMRQQQLALSLVQQTTAAVAKYKDVNAAIADG